MNNEDTWIAELRRFGLTGYESRTYLALLAEGLSVVSVIVAKSGVPQSKVYGTLESLVKKGFAESIMGHVKQFRAIPPLVALENHRRVIDANLTESFRAMKELSVAVVRNTTPSPGEVSESRRSLFAVARDKVQTELLMALQDVALGSDPANEVTEMRKAGIRTHCLLATPTLKSLKTDPAIVEQHYPDSMRLAQKLLSSFCVVDGIYTVVELRDGVHERRALLIQDSRLAESMRQQFFQHWTSAQRCDDSKDAVVRKVDDVRKSVLIG